MKSCAYRNKINEQKTLCMHSAIAHYHYLCITVFGNGLIGGKTVQLAFSYANTNTAKGVTLDGSIDKVMYVFLRMIS